jgi:hypothetical protein
MKLITKIIVAGEQQETTVVEDASNTCTVIAAAAEVVKFTMVVTTGEAGKHIDIKDIAVLRPYTISPAATNSLRNLEQAIVEFAYNKSVEAACEGKINFIIDAGILLNYFQLGLRIIPTEDLYDPYAAYLQTKPKYQQFRERWQQYLTDKSDTIYEQLQAEQKIYVTIFSIMAPGVNWRTLSGPDTKKYWQREDLFLASKNSYFARGHVVSLTALPFTMSGNVTIFPPESLIAQLRDRFTVAAATEEERDSAAEEADPVVQVAATDLHASAELKEGEAVATTAGSPPANTAAVTTVADQQPVAVLDGPATTVPDGGPMGEVAATATVTTAADKQPTAVLDGPMGGAAAPTAIAADAVTMMLMRDSLIAQLLPMFETKLREATANITQAVDSRIGRLTDRMERLESDVKALHTAFDTLKTDKRKEEKEEKDPSRRAAAGERRSTGRGRGADDGELEKIRREVQRQMVMGDFTGGFPKGLGRGRGGRP